MKYNWSKVVDAFRDIVLANVSFEADTPAQKADFMGYMKEMVKETDTFHPFDSDHELSRALFMVPQRVDYRSVKSYRAWKRSREQVLDALFEMLCEVEDKIRDHFSDEWNFAPGMFRP